MPSLAAWCQDMLEGVSFVGTGMTVPYDLEELLDSCRVLFGSELQLSEEFLSYLQITGLKNAYRRRARQTHPDIVGNSVDTSLSFHLVRESYEKLVTFVESRQSSLGPDPHSKGAGRKNGTAFYKERRPSPRTKRQERDGGTNNPLAAIRPFSVLHISGESRVDRLYRGTMPQRRLLFGNFLFYCGLTNWRTITRILTWQRQNRPKVGAIGKALGFWNEDDVGRIIQYQLDRRRRFAEAAFELGYISPSEFREVLTKQTQLQKKFGRILVENEMVSQAELSILLSQFRKHNTVQNR